MPRTSTSALAVAGTIRRDDYRLDDQIGHLLRRAYQVASANLTARLERHVLTPMQFAVLARLRERAPVSQNLLGRLVAMEPANIREVILRLKKRGLVRAERDGADRRLILLSLSSAGAALVETLLPLSRASTAATLRPLNAREGEMLHDLLRRVAAGA
jgi:DNA-binding MarR family transcriptional regulator